jgi:hypothetical protein
MLEQNKVLHAQFEAHKKSTKKAAEESAMNVQDLLNQLEEERGKKIKFQQDVEILKGKVNQAMQGQDQWKERYTKEVNRSSSIETLDVV